METTHAQSQPNDDSGQRSSAKARGEFRLWCFLDFANSLFYPIILLYFPLWFTEPGKGTQEWYNYLFVGSTAIALVLAIPLGRFADRTGNRRKIFAGLNGVFLLSGMFIPLSGVGGLPLNEGQRTWMAAIAFLLTNASYLASLGLYDSLLGDLKKQHDYAKGSASGLIFGWLGAIAGIMLVMPIVSAFDSSWANVSQSRVVGLACGWLICACVSIPALLRFVKGETRICTENKKPKIVDSQSLASPQKSRLARLRAYIATRQKGFWLFLVAYLFYVDALLAVQDNLSLFVQDGLKLGDTDKAKVALGIILTGMIGAGLCKICSNATNYLKWLIWFVIGSAVLTFGVGLGARQDSSFTIPLLLLAFMAYGGVFALSRAQMTLLVPENERATGFAWYSVFQRSGSFSGPLVWTYVLLHSDQGNSHSNAFVAMGILMFIGLMLLLWLAKTVPAATTALPANSG